MAKVKSEVAADPAELVELQAIDPLRIGFADSVEEVAPGDLFSVPASLAGDLIIAGLACLPLPPVLPE